MKKLIFFSVFFIFLGVTVWGDDYTWVGSGDGVSWNDADNWENITSGNIVDGFPGAIADDNVIINTTASINITGSLLNLAALTINTGANLTLSSVPPLPLTTTALNNNGTLNLGSQTVTATTITNTGTLILDGNTSQLGSHTSIGGTVQFSGSGTTLSGIIIFVNLIIQNGVRTGAGAVSVSGNFNLSGGSLNATSLSVSGTSTIGGNITTTGNTQAYSGNVTLGANVTLTGSTVTMGAITGSNRSLTITGDAVFNGLTNSGLTTLSVSGSSLFNATNAMSITTTGTQTYTGAVTLGGTGTGARTLTGTTVIMGAITGAGRALTITGNATLNGGSGIGALQINGTGNTATINGNITATTSVTINATGTTTINAASVTTTGTGTPQRYYGPVVLGTNVNFTGAANSTIRFDGNVYSNSIGTYSLTVTTAILRFSVSVGVPPAGNNYLSSVTASTLTATQYHRLVQGVTTTGNQTYNGNVRLGNTANDTVTLDAGTGTITFGGIVESNNNTARALTIKSGNVVFNGAVGVNNYPISTLTVNGSGNTTINAAVTYNYITTILINSTGIAYINANVGTTGTQTYGTVTFGGTTGETRTLRGTTVTMGATTGDSHPLTITGNAVFNGVVNGVTTLNVSGTTTINTTSITTTGAQTYTGAVTLGANVNLSANAGNLITFGNTVNGAFGLTITTANVQFSNTVGGTTNLASVNVTTGSSTINASITTTGTQTYTGTVTLGGAAGLRTLQGTTVTMGAITGNGHPLTINGNVVLNGGSGIGALIINNNGAAVPNATAIINQTISATSLTLNATGNSSINADITTTGAQTYTGAVTFGGTGTRKIESTGGNITTGTGLVSASDDVTIKASNGIAIGSGGINAATDLTLESGGTVTQSGAIITGTLTLAGNAGFTLNNAGNNIETLQTMAVLPNIYPTIINYTDADDFDIGAGELQAVTRVELKTTGKITIEKNINVTGSGVDPGYHEENAAVYIEANELEGYGMITFASGSGHWACAYITQSTGFRGIVNENGIHYHTTDGRHIVYSSGDSSSFASSLSTTHLLNTENYLYIQADNVNLGLRQDIFTSGLGNIYIVNVDDEDPSNPALTRIVSFNTVSGVSGGHIEIWGKYTAISPGILTLNPGSGGVVLIDAEINLAGNFNTNGTPLTAGGTSGSKINAASIILESGIEGVSGFPSDLTLAAGTIHITGTAGSGTLASLGDLTITGGLTLENTTLSASSFLFNNGQVTLVGNIELETNNGDIKFNYNAAPSITDSGNLTMTAGGDVSILGQAGQSSSHIGDIHIISAGDVTFSSGVYAGDISLNNTDDVTFSSVVNAEDITVNIEGDVTFSGDVNAEDISLNNAGDVTFSGDVYAEDISVNSASDVTFSGDVNAEDISVNSASDVTFSGDVNAEDISVSNTGDVTFSGEVNAVDISVNNADDVTFLSDVNAGNISINNADEVTLSGVVSSGNVTINNGGLYTQNGDVTVNGNFNQTGNGDVDLDGDITINSAAVIGFVSEITLGSSVAFNAPAGGTVKLAGAAAGSYTLTFNGGSASSPLLVEQANTSGIEIDGSLIIAANSYVKINNGSMLTQDDGKGLTLGTNAVLDTSAASWHMGSSGTSDDFAGVNGALDLGAGSKLTVNALNLTGSSFEITNTDWVTISVKGDALIANDVNLSGSYPRLIIEMNTDAASTVQALRAERTLGSLHVREHSRTVLSTNDASKTVSFMGEVKIFSGGFNWLDAGDYDIVMYSGLTGNRNLTNYTHNGSDIIRYTRWENVGALIAEPPYSSPPDMNSFVFRQNTGGKVSFQREPGSTDPVFIEIAGNTMWREFVCSVPGAVVQFSRHPNHHVVLEDFSIGNKSSTAADHSDYVTITRLTDGAYINFPYIYDSSIMGQPPLILAGASVGDLGNYALPVYYPPLDLKNSVEQEKEKYWNINFVTVSGPAQKPLDNFRYVKIFFSHAYNQRIPIETSSMHLDAVPYYRPLTGEGHFNFDWIELRKILYSFTEDSSGDGRLDRIRVQTNVRLNGDFSAFEVNVEGYRIDTSKGINGFRMVNDLTGYNDDEDSFYIYLQQVPHIDSGSTPLWSVTRNESLKDLLTESSSVGDPEIDVDMIPFDTIPPRISYTLTLPGHPQTYVRMSEPVLSLPGGNISDTQAVERSESYIFTWKYFPYDSPPVSYTRPVVSANMGYLLNTPSSLDIETLSRLNNLFGDTTSSETDGYFRMDNIIDQGQRAMDWHDPSVDPAFYIYYQPPKYPLNWAYTEYAKVYGNSHLAGRGLLIPDFSLDDTNAIKSDGSPVPLSDVFLPPNKMLTVEMMTLIAQGDGDKVTPKNFASYSNPSARNSVIRRVTDVLVSLAPASGDSENYFAWPVWTRYQNNANPGSASLSGDFWSQRNTDNGIIWTFDGTDFLEARGFDLQARMNSVLTGSLELFWTTDIPTEYRIPQNDPVRGRSTGGLWLPYPGDLHNNRLLYYFAPLYEGSAVNQSGASSPANPPLFNFALNGENSSGKKMEFVFRINGSSPSDLFVARLDIPRTGAIPENWYYLVRPFGFDIQDIRLQRGGVTVLNNVINSDARENAFIRYHLVRPGRVTVQVYTLDGTLVKSLRRNEYREAGEWTDAWDGSNNSGRAVARGMYFVRVVAPDIDEIRKIMVVR